MTAFETLRSCLISPPVLAYAYFSKPFILNIDASGVGLGAVLYQEVEGGQTVVAYASEGGETVVAYASEGGQTVDLLNL